MKRRMTLLFVCMIFLVSVCACQPGPTDAAADHAPPAVSESSTPTPVQTPVAQQTPEPELTPDTQPTPSPSSVPEDPAPTPAPVTKEEQDAYFDGAVFVGDSIMEGIRQYVAKNRSAEPTLGDARFLTSTIGVSVSKLLNEEETGPFYRYNGQARMLTQILKEMDCSRIFLQLGLNDMAAKDPVVKTVVEDYAQLIDLLEQTVPGAEIIVITNPPKVASTWLPDYTPNRNFNNQLIGEFVAELTDMCHARGIPCVDAYAVLKNENGALPDDWCRDGYVHLNDAGSKVVVEELYRFAAGQLGQE